MMGRYCGSSDEGERILPVPVRASLVTLPDEAMEGQTEDAQHNSGSG